MPIVDVPALAQTLPSGATVFGLDPGDKTLGVAVADLSLTIASPLTVIRRTRFTADAEALLALMAERGGRGLVIGLPVNMDGTEGPRCQSARAFARNLMRLKDMPIAFWDERLSTAAVNRVLIEEADASRARRERAVDKMAAAWILQGALDLLRAGRPAPRTSL
jgi:putative Holliday junction resolvase